MEILLNTHDIYIVRLPSQDKFGIRVLDNTVLEHE
jgi:hypothetical protein